MRALFVVLFHFMVVAVVCAGDVLRPADSVQVSPPDSLPYQSCKADSGTTAIYPAPGEFVPFEVPPQPLPDASPQPDFPAEAKMAGETGKVIVQVLIDTQGNPARWMIVRAEPKDRGFEAEVARIMCDWRFTPALQQGQPVSVWIAIPFHFKYRS